MSVIFDTQHIKIQVGDTSRPWRFRLKSEGRAYAIPAGYSFTLYMVAVDAAEGDDPKINASPCTFTATEDSVYFQPEAGDVDTAGRYRGQLWGLTGERGVERLETGYGRSSDPRHLPALRRRHLRQQIE